MKKQITRTQSTRINDIEIIVLEELYCVGASGESGLWVDAGLKCRAIVVRRGVGENAWNTEGEEITVPSGF